MTTAETIFAVTLTLLIPIGIVAIAAFVAWRTLAAGAGERAGARERFRVEIEARRALARPSTARVVASTPIGPRESIENSGFGHFRDVRLTLLVADTDTPTEARWDVQVLALPRVAPDEVVAVLLDAEDPARVYPASAWARTTRRM